MIQHATADINGIRMHYAHTGPATGVVPKGGATPAGKLIIFAHGFPEFWYCWKDLLPEFGRDHLAVAPDMRGYNLSSKPQDAAQYTMDLLVADLGALAQSLGHKTFTLVAHDWGGGVAWSLALRHPEWLERLIIINSPHPTVFERELNTNPAQQKASMYTRLFQSPKTEALLSANNYQAIADIVVTDGLKRGYFSASDRDAYLAAWSQPGAVTGMLNYYRAADMGPPTKPGQSARSFETGIKDAIVRVPTLVIWGEQDPHLMASNLDGLDAYVPDLTIRRIPDGTHWVIHEQPNVVIGHIRDYLARA